ncbi:MAG TPA: hypothetical protein VF796_11830 [Humisphaera sp.]
MSAKKPTAGTPQDRDSNLRLPAGATADDAMRAVFKIPAGEAQRIRESEPPAPQGKAKRPKRKPK